MRGRVGGLIIPSIKTNDGLHHLTIEFDAPAHEYALVEERITQAMQGGQLEGPDGRTTRWSLQSDTRS